MEYASEFAGIFRFLNRSFGVFLKSTFHFID